VAPAARGRGDHRCAHLGPAPKPLSGPHQEGSIGSSDRNSRSAPAKAVPHLGHVPRDRHTLGTNAVSARDGRECQTLKSAPAGEAGRGSDRIEAA
jgi:hypothetical protein